MGTHPSTPPNQLSDEEAAFVASLVALIESIGVVAQAAQAVQAAGGNAREAFLSTIDDPHQRAMLSMQWPMIATMLQLPL